MAAKGQPKTGGRSKGTPNRATADIKALAQTYGPDAVDTLADIMKDVAAPAAARVAAARELIDRGFGKAIQTVHNAGADGGPMQFAEITQERFGAIAREMADKV
jgi:NAD(P)-dependent dehydrogenase (short-subunit alcohol dehydrogenase family)